MVGKRTGRTEEARKERGDRRRRKEDKEERIKEEERWEKAIGKRNS